MHRIVYFLLFTISLWSLSPEEVLRGRIPSEDKRYGTMLRALRLMQEREVRVVVETGTARNGVSNCRGDGCSTPIFSTWLREVGAEFYSVDIDPATTSGVAVPMSALANSGRSVHCPSLSVRFFPFSETTLLGTQKSFLTGAAEQNSDRRLDLGFSSRYTHQKACKDSS